MKISNKRLHKIIPIMLMASAFAITVPSPMTFASAQVHHLGEDISIQAEFKDTPLTDTFDALSRLSGVPIIVNGELTDKVTINANGQSLAAIIDNIVRAFDLSCTEKNGMIVISDDDTDSNKMTKTFEVEYTDLEELKEAFKTFVDEENISTSALANTITVSGNSAQIQAAQDFLSQHDKKPQQVSLQVKFVDFSKGDLKKYGIKSSGTTEGTGYAKYDWSKTSGLWNFVYHGSIDATLNDNSAKVIARPTLSTRNGKEATINITDKVPILTTTTSNNNTTTTVDYQDVGVKLTTTPRVSAVNDDVTLDISGEVSTVTGYVTNNNVSAPQISTRNVKTNIRCKNGDTIIIGGLLKQEDIKTISSIPLLSKLPILGKLFQYTEHDKRDSELVIMITPVIDGKESQAMDTDRMKKEIRPQNIHNDETMDYASNADRRGVDTKKSKNI